MSDLRPNLDTSTSDESAIADAVAVLAAAAQRNLPGVQGHLKAAGFEIASYAPLQGTPNLDASVASDIGAVIEARGIYHGAWQPRANGALVHAYSDTDMLRNASGKQVLLTWYQTRFELARRNGGRSYGDGTEAALCDALAKPSGATGTYQDGDLVMAAPGLLNGRNVNGKKVRAQNSFDLLCGSKDNAFKNISETLRDGSAYARWSWSGTEGRDDSPDVRVVSLSDGNTFGVNKVILRLGVLPFRFFREPHAAKAVSHLTL